MEIKSGFFRPKRGVMLMTKALLDGNPGLSDEDIRHYLSGDLCRCGGYPEIMLAVKPAARKRRHSGR